MLVFTLIAFVAVCDRASRRPVPSSNPVASIGTDHDRYHNRMFRVARVVDGDTLDIDVPDGNKPMTRIRLWGVDTPEVKGSPKGEMYFGPQASEFAKRILTGRSVYVVLAPEKTRGKYGRLLAYVMLDRGGKMFNELLLEKGLAYADRRFPHAYRKQFEAIEKRARRAGVGLWADITIEKMPGWRQRFERKP